MTSSDAPQMSKIAGLLAEYRPAEGVFIIGVTGGVASGKTTFAAALAADAARWAGDPRIEVMGTDGFILSNAILAERGLSLRKGFPESFDIAALRGVLESVRRGPVVITGYSHAIYDTDPALARRIEAPDILIVEGLGLDRARPDSPGRLLDALIYLDADEAVIEAWFVDRFMGLWRAARHDPSSFYVRFQDLDAAGARDLAGRVWARINRPNLLENLLPVRARADIIVHKSADHRIERVSFNP